MSKDYKLYAINVLLSDLHKYEFKGLSDDLIIFLKENDYSHECNVDNLQCVNCIFKWLRNKKREQLYYSNIPFKSYESKLNFYWENREYFDIEVAHVFSESNILSFIPESKEEAKLYTQKLKKYLAEEIEKEIASGKKYFGIPLETYEEFKNNFIKKYKESPLPRKYLVNEQKRIDELISKIRFSDDVQKVYNSIINCEDIVTYNFELKRPQIANFYIYSRLRPLAEYKIFLEQYNANISETNNKTIDELKILIGDGEVGAVIDILLKDEQYSSYQRELIIHRARYKSVKQNKRMGIISFEDANREERKIEFAILEILSKQEVQG